MAARNPRLAKVHIARKEMRLDDGAYRSMLERITGKTSSADCSDAQLDAVLEEFKAKGWKPSVVAGTDVVRSSPGGGRAQRGAKRRPADHPVAGKARALWISLHQLGVVEDVRESALEAFARRQLQVDVFQWADQGLGYKLIEALKAWAERCGWSQDLAGVPGSRQVRVLNERLAMRQARLLADRHQLIDPVLLRGEFGDHEDDELRTEIKAMAATIWATGGFAGQ